MNLSIDIELSEDTKPRYELAISAFPSSDQDNQRPRPFKDHKGNPTGTVFYSLPSLKKAKRKAMQILESVFEDTPFRFQEDSTLSMGVVIRNG